MGLVDRRSADERAALSDPWALLLAWAAAVVTVVDAIALARARELTIPPAAFGLASLVGIVLLLRWRGVGALVLLLSSALALIDTPAAAATLADPSSGFDFLHGAVGSFGRVLVIVAAFGTWRRAGARAARRLGTSAIGLLGLAVVVATTASLLASAP